MSQSHLSGSQLLNIFTACNVEVPFTKLSHNNKNLTDSVNAIKKVVLNQTT
jgi:hypothetical protein